MRATLSVSVTLATVLAAGAVCAAESTVNDAFSEIPLSSRLIPPRPDPKWSPPHLRSKVFELEYPTSFFKKNVEGCGFAHIAIRVLANGDFAEANLAIPSGFELLDDAAMKYVRKGMLYSPAMFDGKPLEAWFLYRFKFNSGHDECKADPELDAKSSQLNAQFNAPLKALVEGVRAENLRVQAAEQQRLDEDERKRYVAEEPYRTRVPAEPAFELQAKHAYELAHNLVHCGESLFDRDSNFLTEYKGGHYWYKDADQLSEIDRANGYEWRGRVSFFCKMQRTYRISGGGSLGWDDWERCGTKIRQVWKRRGKWHVEGERARPPLSCAEIPPG